MFCEAYYIFSCALPCLARSSAACSCMCMRILSMRIANDAALMHACMSCRWVRVLAHAPIAVCAVCSIGNIKPIFSYEYPTCFKTMKTCNANETRAPDYSQILGIIFGMITLGYVGDRIGRECPLADAGLTVCSQHSVHA